MEVPYSRCMIFLTYLKGPLTATWASSISQDITDRVRGTDGADIHDEHIWHYLVESFRRPYTDNQEQECAEDTLQQGICMNSKDLDGYIARYEALIIEAGYNHNNRLCLRKFTDGLPHDLYQDAIRLDHPRNYE